MKNKLFFYLILVACIILVSCQKKESNSSVEPEPKPFNDSTLLDSRDGTTYKLVKIGNQTWFSENLKYAGSMPNHEDFKTWNSAVTPAWCYYANNESNNSIYGKLYNGYAVKNGSLCPNGWRIPSDEDWKELEVFLGGSNIAGGKLKSTKLWNAPNTGANNSSGFSALPSGYRKEYEISSDIGFEGITTFTNFWSTTPYNDKYNWARHINFSNALTGRFYGVLNVGYPCRCVKND